MRPRLVADVGVPLGLAAASIASGVAGAVGLWSLTLIDQSVLLGIGVVLPLVLGGRWWAWVAAYAGALASFLLPTGLPAAVLAGPLMLAAGAAVVPRVPPDLRRRRIPPVHELLELLTAIYAVAAAGALVQSRLGAPLLGIHEPIVELTAVHYIFAGSGALALARAAAAEVGEAPGGGRLTHWLKTCALWLTAMAPPIVALGFVTRSAGLQVGGAIAMTLGVLSTAGLQLQAASRGLAAHDDRRLLAPVLLAVSGLAPWVPMGLAVTWAAGQHWDVPALSIPDMAQLHGLTNAFGFVICGLVARQVHAAPRRAPCVGAGGLLGPPTPRPAPHEVVRL